MDTFLQILGIIALVVVTVVAFGGLYLWMKWKGLKKLMKNGFNMDVEIELKEDNAANWTTFDKAVAYDKSICALGFTKVNNYVASVGIELACYLNSDHTHCAVITNTGMDMSMEFTAIDADKDQSIDVTDNESVAALTPRSYKVSLGRPDFTPEQLHQLFTETVAGKNLKVMPPAELSTIIEEAFKKEMQALTDEGGLGEVDIDNLIEQFGEDLSDEERNELINGNKTSNMEQNWQVCLNALEESGEVTPKVWNKYEYQMIVTKNDYELDVFNSLLLEEIDFDFDEEDEEEKNYQRAKDLLAVAENSDDAVAKLTTAFPQLNITLLAELQSPTTCKIYGYQEPDFAEVG